MKRLIVIITLFALVFTCAASVMAAEEFATAGDLFQYWEETTYPDYVCGVWSNDGGITNLNIAVQDNEAGKAGQQEILDLIVDDSTVTFTYQQYSKNYLRWVQEEIFPYFGKDLGLVSAGVNEYKNRLELGILEEKADNAETKAMLAELKEQYGDIFIIEYSGTIVETLEDTLADVSAVSYANRIYVVIAACAVGAVLLAVYAIIAARKKSALTMQTATGENITASASLSTKDVENMVKSTNAEISSELDGKIMSEIEKL